MRYLDVKRVDVLWVALPGQGFAIGTYHQAGKFVDWALRCVIAGQPLRVKQGQRVVIEMVNHSMMAHPMHLHGHHFQVLAVNGSPVRGAMRDTVLVPPHMGSVTIAFDADNPGRWVFHCHNLMHMATGMMTEVAYDKGG